MFAESSVVLLPSAAVALALLWRWRRSRRFGKLLTPITDGRFQPIEFRPGPPPLPEHDAALV